MLNQLMLIKSYLLSIKSQKGVTMIEYALIAALVSVVAITILGTVGDNLTEVFTSVSNALAPAAE